MQQTEQACCKTCKHFRQHYVQYGRRYDWANCGHCVYPRLKTRAPDTPACGHYRPRGEKKETPKAERGAEGKQGR